MNCKKNLAFHAIIAPVLLILNINFAVAQPVITSITGTLGHGNAITINGGNFGTKASPAPLHWDPIDDLAPYDTLSDGDRVPDLFFDGDVNSLYNKNNGEFTARYETSNRKRHARSAAHFATVGRKMEIGEHIALGGDNPPISQRQIYVNWWYRPSFNPNKHKGSNKFIRIFDNPNGQEMRISWTQLQITYGQSNTVTGCPSGTSFDTWDGVAGGWNKHEIFVDLDAGIIQAWVNGRLVHDINNPGDPQLVATNVFGPGCAATGTAKTFGLNVKLMGFDSSVSAYKNMLTEIDDIYADSTQARVFIADSPFWGTATTKSEVQIASSWSGSNIGITLNQGAFPSFQFPLYLYVVDSNGQVSNPFPLCNDCPETPDALKVKVIGN